MHARESKPKITADELERHRAEMEKFGWTLLEMSIQDGLIIIEWVRGGK